MRTPRQRLGPWPPRRSSRLVTSGPPPGPALLPPGVREAAGGSALRRAASDGLGPLAEWKARVPSTTWRWLPFLSLLFSACPLAPRRKQAYSSRGPVLEKTLGETREKGRSWGPTLSALPPQNPHQVPSRSKAGGSGLQVQAGAAEWHQGLSIPPQPSPHLGRAPTWYRFVPPCQARIRRPKAASPLSHCCSRRMGQCLHVPFY